MTVLMTCVLDDPNTSGNGRSGQKQHGVDIYGQRNRAQAQLVGVQCKRRFEAAITEKELRTEVGKAKKFRPKLKEFILATTAPRDQAIQTVARTITDELSSTDYPMEVLVWGWDDIEERASRYDEAFNAFDPTYNPYAKKSYEKLDAKLQQAVDIISRIQGAPQPTDVKADADDQNTPLHGQISAYVNLINDGHVEAAVIQLEKLRTNSWATASRSERYRILLAFAAANVKNDDYAAAGRVLLDAFAECPEHKKAKQNRAKGYLLIGDYPKASEIALETLKCDSGNADAANVLIQARMHDPTCSNPLADISDSILEAEEVLVAHIHFLRLRNDISWLMLARQAARKHPASQHLQLIAAESVLEDLTKNDRDVLAGSTVRVVTQDELEAAVKILADEAQEVMRKGLPLSPWLANNSALALRFIDDSSTAIKILDAAIAKHPTDENLCFQRAILAYSQNDLSKVLALIPEKPANPEALSMRAKALADTGKPDEALKLIDGFDTSAVSDEVRFGVIAARCHAHLLRKEKSIAIENARKEVLRVPADVRLACVLIRTLYLAGESDAALKALDAARLHIDDSSSMPLRLLLSFEAQRLDRSDIIVSLLVGRVAIDHDNEALQTLVTASINGHFWVTAREVLDALSPRFNDVEWAQKARAILALNVGSRDAEQKVGAYLKKWPNDATMMLARIGAWQRVGREKDIASFLSSVDLTAIEGSVRNQIRIASLVCRYESTARGLAFGYAVLMNNWDRASAHLAYQGLILLNENIASALPVSSIVGENTAVFLTGEGSTSVYRLEKDRYKFFADEQLGMDSELARLILGRKVGDSFLLQERIGAKPVTVSAIKSVYIDAFHRSLNGFNERFPSAKGMMKFTFDATAEDPLEEMRAITKQQAESNLSTLEHYRKTRVALAFIAHAMGRDPLDVWEGLPSVNTKFQVCHGVHQEREKALKLLKARDRKGCVIDVITLSVIRRLDIADAVVSVCGPLHTPQSTLDLLASRAIETRNEVGKQLGVLSWHNEQLIMRECTSDMLREAAEKNETERAWAFENAAVVTAMPKNELEPKARTIVEMVGEQASDPVIAADGSGLLLLSDDMGLRTWAEVAFEVSSTWLQPVLMVAREEEKLTHEEYFEAINTMALSGHSYISLEPGALLYQAHKTKFELNDDLRRLLETIGGPSADLQSNCKVAADFLDLVTEECSDPFKTMRITSHTFESMAKGRGAEQRAIVARMWGHMKFRREWMREHVLAWLIGHSLGMEDFNGLVSALQKSLVRRPG